MSLNGFIVSLCLPRRVLFVAACLLALTGCFDNAFGGKDALFQECERSDTLCDGTVAQNCTDDSDRTNLVKSTSRVDCADSGQSCQVLEDEFGNAWATCVIAVDSCPKERFCDEDFIATCQDVDGQHYVQRKQFCPEQQETCVEWDNGDVQCSFREELCEPELVGTNWCEGSLLLSCDVARRVNVTVDCSVNLGGISKCNSDGTCKVP